MGLIQFLICCSRFAFAQADRLYIDPKQTVTIEYQSAAWNKKSDFQDQGLVWIRNNQTGSLTPVLLKETYSNSSVFMGSVKSMRSDQLFTPEIYLSGTDTNEDQVQSWIRLGQIARKPFFLEPRPSEQKITVYDTSAVAYASYANYMRLLADKRLQDLAALMAQQQKEREEVLRLEAERLQQLEKERIARSESEKSLREQKLLEQRKLSEAEKNRRIQLSIETATKAIEAYKLQKYQEASNLFKESIALDPSNNQFYFQYGVSLYQQDEFNQALAIFNLAQTGDFNPAEKTFYQGLCHFRLRELKPAGSFFKATQDHASAQKNVRTSATFYLGVVEYQLENYDQAKLHFERVIDTSDDPQLDRQSESYIEQIANIKNFQERQRRPFTINLNVGLAYDSNIFATSINTTTDLAGYRLIYGGSLDYRFFLTEKHEGSVKYMVNDTNSLASSQFKYLDAFQRYDPILTQFSTAYRRRTQINRVPLQVSLVPFYESISMDVDGAVNTDAVSKNYALRNREQIVSSFGLRSEFAIAASNNWYSSPVLEIRRDHSYLDTTDDENQTANKTSLTWVNSYFLNQKKSKSHAADISYAVNSAVGKNQTYTRLDLGYTWTAPVKTISGYSARISVGQSTFGASTTGRQDTHTSLSLGLRVPLSNTWTWQSSALYNQNASNVAIFQFDKYVLLSQMEWADIF